MAGPVVTRPVWVGDGKKNYPSTARLAADPWIRGASQAAASEWRRLLAEAERLTRHDREKEEDAVLGRITIAGSLRTLIGKQLGGDFNAELIAELKQTACHGPLLVSTGRLFFPAPADALQHDGQVLMLRPNAACRDFVDLPGGLLPVTLDLNTKIEKFASAPAWWSQNQLVDWLLLTADPSSSFLQPADEFRSAPVIDQRTHVKILPNTQASEDGMLFSTSGLVLDQVRSGDGTGNSDSQMVVRVLAPASSSRVAASVAALNHFQTVGGERRLAVIAKSSNPMTSERMMTCRTIHLFNTHEQ